MLYDYRMSLNGMDIHVLHPDTYSSTGTKPSILKLIFICMLVRMQRNVSVTNISQANEDSCARDTVLLLGSTV